MLFIHLRRVLLFNVFLLAAAMKPFKEFVKLHQLWTVYRGIRHSNFEQQQLKLLESIYADSTQFSIINF